MLLGLVEPENLGAKRVKIRPDFLEAREKVENYPVQVLFAVPDFVKKVIADTRPTLPEPLEKTDLARLIGGLRYKAVGINPAKPELYAIAALKLYYNSRTIFECIIQGWESGLPNDARESDKELHRHVSEFLTRENLEYFLDAAIPKPQRTQFTILWDAKTIRDSVHILGEAIEPWMLKALLTIAGGESARL